MNKTWSSMAVAVGAPVLALALVGIPGVPPLLVSMLILTGAAAFLLACLFGGMAAAKAMCREAKKKGGRGWR